MEGDFTRNNDDREAGYSGVLMQQGRVQLDADWNEQWAIQTRALRAALRDIIGRHGGPCGDFGFSIAPMEDDNKTLRIGCGVYYVDGIRCVLRGDDEQLAMADRKGVPYKKGSYIAVLDVWDRHVNAVEDPRLREIALHGPDTATRAQVVWRVRLLDVANVSPTTENVAKLADCHVDEQLRKRPRRRLAARAVTVNATTDPCQLSPQAQFRGRENQLYRVQIHDGWSSRDKAGGSGSKGPVLFTFKWSRDNGSVVFPIVRTAAPDSPAAAGDGEIAVTVQVGHAGRDARFGLEAGDIVEFVHDAVTRETLDDDALVSDGRDPGRSGHLGRVLAPIDRDDLTVRIAVYADDITEITDCMLHPYLRRWDQRAGAHGKLVRGAVPVRPTDLDKWLPLEGGVEVLFEGDRQGQRPAEQRAGQYWLIPARTVSGDVLWPTTESGTPAVRKPVRMSPHGPHHHYAPLALVFWSDTEVTQVIGVRRRFEPISSPEPGP